MLAPLIFAAMLQRLGSYEQITLYDIENGKATMSTRMDTDPMAISKLSPKKFGDPAIAWEFPWVISGFVTDPAVPGQQNLRFRVYSQERKAKDDRAPMVARMLLRLWELNQKRLQLDHAMDYNRKILDVYLCWGGKAGGEQLFDLDSQGERPRKVNTIYFYDLNSFTDPVEMAREVAHEYGHATLPAVGGFKDPEDWANGYLGEKIYLTYMRDEIRKGRLAAGDTMGATADQLDQWLKTNVDPLVHQAALDGPRADLLKAPEPTMDRYLGLALYAQRILPPAAFARSLKLIGSVNPADYPAAVAAAADEIPQYAYSVPSELTGQAIWLPLGDSKIAGGRVLARRNEWAKVQPIQATITVTSTRTQ